MISLNNLSLYRNKYFSNWTLESISLLGLILSTSIACSSNLKPVSTQSTDTTTFTQTTKIDKIIHSLSLQQKVGQLFIFGFKGKFFTPAIEKK